MAEPAGREDRPQTIAEVEAWHARQPKQWEFVAGEPQLMAPGSLNHVIIKRNAFRALDRAQADRGCEVLVDGPQILTDEISAIPDLIVTCAPLDHATPVIAEPAVIVEVMSPSSEADDAGLTWLSYRKIPSLRHYLVVSQTERLVHVHSRAGDLWRERFVGAGAVDLDDPLAVRGAGSSAVKRRAAPHTGS